MRWDREENKSNAIEDEEGSSLDCKEGKTDSHCPQVCKVLSCRRSMGLICISSEVHNRPAVQVKGGSFRFSLRNFFLTRRQFKIERALQNVMHSLPLRVFSHSEATTFTGCSLHIVHCILFYKDILEREFKYLQLNGP